MSKIKWIDTNGPLVLIAEKSYKLWSGILKRNEYLENNLELADDFMDGKQADYGKACEISEYLGTVELGTDFALVLGDEPMPTTVIKTKDNNTVIIRILFAENEDVIENIIANLQLTEILDWQSSVIFDLSSNEQFLFDSTLCYHDIMENKNYLNLNIIKGKYRIWTSTYLPNNYSKFIIHKFEIL